MKKVKLILIAALVVMMLLTVTACSGGKVFSTKDYEADEAHVYTTATKIDYDGYTYDGSRANFVLLSLTGNNNLKTQVIYDIANKAEIGKFIDAESATQQTKYTVSLYSYTPVMGENAIGYYVVETRITTIATAEVTYSYSLYQADLIKTFDSDVQIANVTSRRLDIVTFGDELYRFGDDGKLVLLRAENELAFEVPDLDGKNGSDYYDVANNKLFVYDSNLNLKFYYSIQQASQDLMIAPVDTNKYFVQYTVKKFDTDKDYDYFTDEGGVLAKYDLVQKVVDAKSGSEKDVDTGMYIDIIVAQEDMGVLFNGIKKNIKYVAIGNEIINKQITIAEDSKYFAIDKNGKLGVQLDGTIINEANFDIIANDRVVITDTLGRSYLYDFKEKLIGQVNNVNEYTNKYIVSDKAIYDLDLNKVFDIEAEKCEFVRILGDNVVLSEVTDTAVNYYLFDGTKKSFNIAATDDLDFIDADLYVIESTVGTGKAYTVYNSQMATVASVSVDNAILVNKVAQYDDVKLVRMGDKFYVVE